MISQPTEARKIAGSPGFEDRHTFRLLRRKLAIHIRRSRKGLCRGRTALILFRLVRALHFRRRLRGDRGMRGSVSFSSFWRARNGLASGHVALRALRREMVPANALIAPVPNPGRAIKPFNFTFAQPRPLPSFPLHVALLLRLPVRNPRPVVLVTD